MSQRMRRTGSPIPTSSNLFPPCPVSNTAMTGVGSPPSTAASVGTSPGMCSFSRLGPMKATVPFQLKQPQQHSHQTAFITSNRSLQGNGVVIIGGGSNTNCTNNAKFHEASSSCAPGERGGGARTPTATSHNRSPLSRASPISSTDSTLLTSPYTFTPLFPSSPDCIADGGPPDSVSFSSGTASLPLNPSPIGIIPLSTSSSSLAISATFSYPFTISQAPQPPPRPPSPTQNSVTPLSHGSSVFPPSSCSPNPSHQIDSLGHVLTAPSTQAPSHSSPSCCPSSTPADSSVSPTSSSSLLYSIRLTAQNSPPDRDGATPPPPERTSPPSPTAEQTTPSSSSSSIRRTSSLDALTGPYLAGHWPRDINHTPSCLPCMKDKATQTPSEWAEDLTNEEKRSNHHKRSASWGSSDQLKEIAKLRQQLQRSKHSNRYHRDKDRKSPFNGSHTSILQPQAPVPRCVLLSLPLVSKATVGRFRNSVEGLNQEIEKITITHCKPQEDIPDGRRAPPPLLALQSQSRITSPLLQPQTGMVSRTVDTQTPNPTSNSAPIGNHSNSSSRAQSVSPFSPCATEEREVEREEGGTGEEEGLCTSEEQLEGREKDQYPGSPLPKYSCSPKPNNSYMFKREPPEGCEKVKVFTEDTHSKRSLQSASPAVLGGPDRNKVNFVLNNIGSAFSILRKPLPS